MGKLPNFIIIGAGKSGTTSLYEYLSEHPDVFMSGIKETNFFALEGTEMVDSENDPDQMFHYPWSITDWEAYQALFTDATNHKAVGEVSPMYLYSPHAAKKIKNRLPDVKIVAILRDPVDRLYSRYMHLVRENRQPSESFEDALDPNSIWWKRNDLIKEGFYNQHLSHYYREFNKDQIRVYLYDDLRSNPAVVIQDIYSFIGVDSTFSPDLTSEYNASGRIQNQLIDKLIGQNSLIKKGVLTLLPNLAQRLFANGNLKKWVNKLRKSNLKKEPLKANTRRKLIENVYGSEIKGLESLIDANLTKWLQTH